MPTKKNIIDFEKRITELEAIVDSMADDKLPLEKALAQFEKGVKLSGDCQKALQQAEQKVKILLDKHTDSELDDFFDDDEE